MGLLKGLKRGNALAAALLGARAQEEQDPGQKALKGRGQGPGELEKTQSGGSRGQEAQQQGGAEPSSGAARRGAADRSGGNHDQCAQSSGNLLNLPILLF